MYLCPSRCCSRMDPFSAPEHWSWQRAYDLSTVRAEQECPIRQPAHRNEYDYVCARHVIQSLGRYTHFSSKFCSWRFYYSYYHCRVAVQSHISQENFLGAFFFGEPAHVFPLAQANAVNAYGTQVRSFAVSILIFVPHKLDALPSHVICAGENPQSFSQRL